MRIIRRFIISTVLFSIAGCAHHSHEIAAQQVSKQTHKDMSCAQVHADLALIRPRRNSGV